MLAGWEVLVVRAKASALVEGQLQVRFGLQDLCLALNKPCLLLLVLTHLWRGEQALQTTDKDVDNGGVYLLDAIGIARVWHDDWQVT